MKRNIFLLSVSLLIMLSMTTAFAKSFQTKEFVQAKQVGMALRLYAEDHQGLLPPKLEALVPGYLRDDRIFANLRYLAAGADIKSVPDTAILLQTVQTDETGSIILVFPDSTVYFKIR